MLKNNILTWLIYYVALLPLASCTTLLPLTFETLQPAAAPMPPQTEQVLFVNRLTERSCRIGNTHITTDNKHLVYKIACGSLLQYIPSELYALLQENRYFPPTSYVEKGVDSSITSFDYPVIALDGVIFDTHLTEKVIVETLYYTHLEVRMQAVLTLYTPHQSTPQSILFQDTISWEAKSYTLEEAKSLMPAFDEVIELSSNHLITSLAQKFSPYHIKSDRELFYIPTSAPMRDAYHYWRENKPREASYLWEYAYEHDYGKKRKAMAAHNVALCYELQDNLPMAIEWLEKALEQLEGKRRKSEQAKLINSYLHILKSRLETDRRVVKQLPQQ